MVIALFGQELMQLGSNMNFVPVTSGVTARQRMILPSKTKYRMNTPRFRSKIGGVAFFETAMPSENIKSKELSLNYSELQNCIEIKVGGAVYNPELPLWQLIPIANYIESGNDNVVTIYNNNNTNDKTYPLYNVAFLDNLLGLRLLQLDLILAGRFLALSDAWAVPRNSNGYVLADSEKEFNLPLTQSKELKETESWIESSMFINCLIAGESWTTYVFTDYNEKIEFDVVDNNFVISGEPYYNFTYDSKTETDYTSFNEELYDSMQAIKEIALSDDGLRYTTYVSNDYFIKLFYTLREKFKDPNFSEKIVENEQIAKEAIEFANTHKKNYLKRDSEFSKLVNQELLANKNDEYLGYINDYINNDNVLWAFETIGILDKELNKFEKIKYKALIDYYNENKSSFCDSDISDLIRYIYANSKKVIVHDELVEYFKEHSERLFSYNPVVFSSAVTTMRWAAFFRYIKKEYPLMWSDFYQKVAMQSLNSVDVQTPYYFTSEM